MSGFYRSKLKRPIVAASELSSQGFRRRWIHAIDAVKVDLFLLVGLPGCDAQLQRCTDHLGNAARGYVSKKIARVSSAIWHIVENVWGPITGANIELTGQSASRSSKQPLWQAQRLQRNFSR